MHISSLAENFFWLLLACACLTASHLQSAPSKNKEEDKGDEHKKHINNTKGQCKLKKVNLKPKPKPRVAYFPHEVRTDLDNTNRLSDSQPCCSVIPVTACATSRQQDKSRLTTVPMSQKKTLSQGSISHQEWTHIRPRLEEWSNKIRTNYGEIIDHRRSEMDDSESTKLDNYSDKIRKDLKLLSIHPNAVEFIFERLYNRLIYASFECAGFDGLSLEEIQNAASKSDRLYNTFNNLAYFPVQWDIWFVFLALIKIYINSIDSNFSNNK